MLPKAATFCLSTTAGLSAPPMAGSSTGARRAHKCWIAWAGACETNGALRGAEWDGWAMADTALEVFKRRVHGPRLDPDVPAPRIEPKRFKPAV